MKFIIEEKTLQSVVTYLAQKPFNEVYQLIMSLQNLQKITDPKDTKSNATND